MDKCVLGHIALNLMTNDFRKIAEQRDVPDPTTSIEFVSPNATDIRITNAFKAQRYSNQSGKARIEYLEKDGVELYDIINENTLKCLKN